MGGSSQLLRLLPTVPNPDPFPHLLSIPPSIPASDPQRAFALFPGCCERPQNSAGIYKVLQQRFSERRAETCQKSKPAETITNEKMTRAKTKKGTERAGGRAGVYRRISGLPQMHSDVLRSFETRQRKRERDRGWNVAGKWVKQLW